MLRTRLTHASPISANLENLIDFQHVLTKSRVAASHAMASHIKRSNRPNEKANPQEINFRVTEIQTTELAKKLPLNA